MMRIVSTIISLALFASLSAQAAGDLKISHLKCEYRTNTLGIDTLQPRLSWQLESKVRNQSQTAYQILAASTPDKLSPEKADLWNSGKVFSRQSIHIRYAGKALHSGQRIYWKLRAWDFNDEPSGFSDDSWFELGLLNPGDWRASWITSTNSTTNSEDKMFDDHPAPLFRREFTLEKKVAQARLYISGLGYYEARLNGERVGDHQLDPGWTSYSKRVLYSTYDVTDQIKKGPNVLGVMVGNGWFNPLPLRFWGWLNLRDHLAIGNPQFIAQLSITFTDGTKQTIASDESWKVADGPVLRNNVYLGEVYDARREKSGWDAPGYNDSDWASTVVAKEKLGHLDAQDAPPIRITQVLKPVALTQPRPGVFIFDLGQNFAGWARLRAKGPAGTRITLRYGELLNEDGTLNGLTSVAGQIKQGGTNYTYDGKGAPKTAWQQDTFILKGRGEEIFTPHFTFHGFRYVELTGFPGKPDLKSLEGLRLNSDVEPAGSFTCSNELFNRIQRIVLWTELSNLFSVQSDCPHREKFGYGGDLVADCEMGILNFDMSRFYAKAVQDLSDAATTNGGFTETAPFAGIVSEGLGGNAGPVGWGTAQPFLQWQLYQYYGDKRLLEENYTATKRWMTFLQSCAKDDILDNGISDHESLVPKPRALTGTAFYFLSATLFARIAHVLGQNTDEAEAKVLAEKIKTAFNAKFLQTGTGSYDTASQACQSFALALGLVPESELSNASSVLTHDLAQHGWHLTTGIFGTKFMLEALPQVGRADAAYALVNQTSFPGWGHMLARGATTLWEHWEFSDNTYSHNHPMFGSVSEWFYKSLAGIQPAPNAVGFDNVIIKPELAGDLTWVKGSYNSVHGPVVSEWRREGNNFNLQVSIPVGSHAKIFLPASNLKQIREGKKPLSAYREIHFEGMEGGRAKIALGAGQYDFTAPLR